ncbi:MAG: phage tail tape measure protein, partial [Janthinobacterium lividum]
MANGNDLKLRVLFNMVDGVTAPLRGIMGGSKNLAKALKGTREELSKLQKVQKDVTAFREMRTGLSSTSNSLTTARERVKGLARSLRDYGPPSQQMTANLNAAREAARRLTSQQKKQATELQQVRQRLAGAGIDTRNLAEHQRTLAAQIAGSNRALAMQEEKLNRVTRASRKMQANRKAFDNAKQFAGSTAAVGATSGALGGGILMSLKSVLTPAVQYNAAMSKVQALGQLDKNSEDFKALRQQSRDLGASTSFTDTQIAQGQGFLAMAGFRPQKIIKSMPGMLNMAKAGGIGLDRAADISSNILTGFGLDPDDMDRVSDVMTMTFTTSNTNLEMLGETMKYVGPVARAAGMDLEQASATAGLLGNAGIQASQAGTTLRSMLLRLASPTSKATKALKELKVSSLDAKGNVRDIPSILRDVAVATEKMGSGKRLGYLKRIFGEEPAAGMAELISQQGVRGIEKYVEIVRNSGGAAQRIGQIMSDNLAGDLQLTQSALEDLGITMSDSVDSPLRKVTQWVNKAILAVSKWAQRNPELTATLTKIALVLGAVLTVAGMLTLTLAAVVVPLAAVKMSLGVLGIKG